VPDGPPWLFLAVWYVHEQKSASPGFRLRNVPRVCVAAAVAAEEIGQVIGAPDRSRHGMLCETAAASVYLVVSAFDPNRTFRTLVNDSGNVPRLLAQQNLQDSVSAECVC
jgi:hypothetical protein